MTSVTSPQQTSRGGADIPGPRGGQGVRLLVLGADADAQDLRDQALAAGFELAQRYSSRVSHVAYGSGVDPGDAKYSRIRDAGLAIVPLQACASQLGLKEEEEVGEQERRERKAEAVTGAATEAGTEGVAEVGALDVDVDADVDVDVAGGAIAGADVQAEAEADAAVGPVEFPTLRQVTSSAASVAEDEFESRLEAAGERFADDLTDPLVGSAAGLVPGFDLVGSDVEGDVEDVDDVVGVRDAYAPLHASSPSAMEELPLGAGVIGADPWTGAGGSDDVAGADEDSEASEGSPDVDVDAGFGVGRGGDRDRARAGIDAGIDVGVDVDADGEAESDGEIDAGTDITGFIPVTPDRDRDRDLEAADATVTETAAAADSATGSAYAAAGSAADASAAPTRVSARYVLASLVWALSPFVTFGLLTPAVFGYAAFRLRSRVLAAATLGYTVAVVLSFALSATHPHAVSPSDASGALLTLALAATWIGGTVHALSLRVKVFAR